LHAVSEPGNTGLGLAARTTAASVPHQHQHHHEIGTTAADLDTARAAQPMPGAPGRDSGS
jgi:hypothetical protein